MAIDSVVAYGPSLGRDHADHWKRIAASRLGLPASNLIWAHRSISLEHSIASVAIGSGTAAAGAKGITLSSAGVANSGRSIGLDNLNLAKASIPTAATGKWWIGGQIEITTAIGNQATIGIGVNPTVPSTVAHELMFGVVGATSTTNFVAVGTAGATIDSGIAIDTAAHDFQVWRDGVNTYVQVDNNPIVSGTARPNASGIAIGLLGEVSTTTRTAIFRWLAVATNLS